MNVDDDLIQEIWRCFGRQQYIYFATVEGDQPRVRPVTLLHFRERLYIVTGSGDAKVKQLKENPKTEFCLLLKKGGEKGTLRAECLASIVEDKKIKSDIFNEVSYVKEFYKSPEDPGYALVRLKPVGFEYMKPGEMQAVKVKL